MLQLAPPDLIEELNRHRDTYHPAWKDGLLLNDGGLAAQPARYVALMQLMTAYDRRTQARYDEITTDTDEEG